MMKANEATRKELVIALSGDHNRFLRQKIAEAITGEKKPLVKCGISHLVTYAQENAITSSETNTEGATCAIGQQVIRKKCQRRGKVTAIEGEKVTVELEDGSTRNPNKERFLKLYINA